jgi:serine/tyrosine/threonine adenylyltransferase
MMTILQDGDYRPDPAILEIADFIADPVEAADFPEIKLRFRNDRWATSVGLSSLTNEQWCEHFGRFTPLPGNLEQPLAMRYHGHQFRVYNPDIGDGRGFLFAQMRDSDGRLMDLGTKGSGPTPWSRFGDGRLTLKGAVREILATEMLEALGVETSKTFSVIETGEALHRGDEPSPTRSAVLVRLNHSHMRIGNFQRLATLGDTANLKRLIGYALEHYFGEEDGEDAPLRLLRHTVARTAKMAASFMAAGFVHGVLNSDNINITGESFDYGPWRFAPTFDAGFTAAYFDHANLYAFGRQAEAIHWDVAQLAIAFSSLAAEDDLLAALHGFGEAYRKALVPAMLGRLGVETQSDGSDIALVQALERALVESQCSLDAFFFDWRGGTCRKPDRYQRDAFADLKTLLSDYRSTAELNHRYWSEELPCSMLIEEVEAIWQPIADSDDWSLLYAKVSQIRAMGEALRTD